MSVRHGEERWEISTPPPRPISIVPYAPEEQVTIHPNPRLEEASFSGTIEQLKKVRKAHETTIKEFIQLKNEGRFQRPGATQQFHELLEMHKRMLQSFFYLEADERREDLKRRQENRARRLIERQRDQERRRRQALERKLQERHARTSEESQVQENEVLLEQPGIFPPSSNEGVSSNMYLRQDRHLPSFSVRNETPLHDNLYEQINFEGTLNYLTGYNGQNYDRYDVRKAMLVGKYQERRNQRQLQLPVQQQSFSGLSREYHFTPGVPYPQN